MTFEYSGTVGDLAKKFEEKKHKEAGIQAVFRLHLYGEKSFPEIAAILDQSESAVKSQYYRLLGRLRKEFDPNG